MPQSSDYEQCHWLNFLFPNIHPYLFATCDRPADLTDGWSFDKCSMCVAALHYCVWFCLCLGVNLPNLCYFLSFLLAGHNSRLNSGTRSVSEQVQHLQSSASPAFSRLLLLNLCSCEFMLNSMHDFVAVSTKSMSSLVFDFVIYSCLSARAPAVLIRPWVTFPSICIENSDTSHCQTTKKHLSIESCTSLEEAQSGTDLGYTLPLY